MDSTLSTPHPSSGASETGGSGAKTATAPHQYALGQQASSAGASSSSETRSDCTIRKPSQVVVYEVLSVETILSQQRFFFLSHHSITMPTSSDLIPTSSASCIVGKTCMSTLWLLLFSFNGAPRM